MTTTKWIGGLIIITVVVVGGIILNSQRETENSSVEDPESQTSDTSLSTEGDLFIEYQEGGGFDIYEDGDRYGYKMAIKFSGNVIVYERIYRIENGERTIDEVEINKGSIERSALDSLVSSIDEAGYFEYPQRLPDVSPLEAEMRSPAQQITISIRNNPGDELKTVWANLGADREHYPENFFELRREFRQLLDEFRNRDDQK